MLLILEVYVMVRCTGAELWEMVKHHPPVKFCNKLPHINIFWLGGGGDTELCTVFIRH